MIITVQLDVESLQLHNDQKQQKNKITQRKSLSEKKNFENSRIQSWLEETYEEGPWNVLEDARKYGR